MFRIAERASYGAQPPVRNRDGVELAERVIRRGITELRS
jgi:hypothetical protein